MQKMMHNDAKGGIAFLTFISVIKEVVISS